MKAGLWYLYANDQELAIHLLNRTIRGANQNDEKHALISLLTYIGDYNGCSNWLDEINGEQEIVGRQSRYRILRSRSEPNPWKALIGSGGTESLLNTLDVCFETGKGLCINLYGGIGDQLEAAGLLQANLSSIPNNHSLYISPQGENKDVIRNLLSEVRTLQVIPEEDQETMAVSLSAFRHWLGNTCNENQPESILRDSHRYTNKKRVLTCFRCKVDPKNPLSSFSRSLPFRTIVEFYENLEISDLEVWDLSDYNEFEQRILMALRPSLRLVREKVKSLDDTRKLMSECGMLATVDTSLVHLSALCGREIHLMLNYCPDERWIDLLRRDGCYKRHIKLHQQQGFHQWGSVLRSLTQEISLYANA